MGLLSEYMYLFHSVDLYLLCMTQAVKCLIIDLFLVTLCAYDNSIVSVKCAFEQFFERFRRLKQERK